MAIWNITDHEGTVVVTWMQGGTKKECGRGPEDLRAWLTAWIFETSAPGDIIVSHKGVFIRMAAPITASGEALPT